MKVILVFIAILAYGLDAAWNYTGSTTRQLAGEIVNRVATGEKVVALTFDDGPTPGYTQRILDILQDQDTRATFFLVGNSIRSHPEEARRIVEAGHEVGNHSYSHSYLVLRDYAFIADELGRTDELIRDAGFDGPILFRPPYGRKLVNLPLYLQGQGIPSITWDVAPETWTETVQSREEIVQRVVDGVRPGSIVLLHVMFPSRENTMAAVPDVIRGLRSEGYRFVTVSELLEYRNPNSPGD